MSHEVAYTEFVYQDTDKEGHPVELFYIQGGETMIGWQLDIVPSVLMKFKEAYKNAVDMRAIRRMREKEAAIQAIEDLLKLEKGE